MTLYYYSVHKLNLITDSTINLPGILTKEDNKLMSLESLRGFKFVISVPQLLQNMLLIRGALKPSSSQ